VHKLLAIAGREYKAAVRTKAFVISLVLVPVLWGVSIGVQVLMHKAEDRSVKKYAVVDRTPDRYVAAVLQAAVTARNEKEIYDIETGEQDKPRYELVAIEPSAPDRNSILQQRYDLSRQCEQGEFEGFLDVGPDVYAMAEKSGPGPAADDRREKR
jgi:hypothetical protein